MLLCYSALSPFCRKVRMVLDWKGIDHEVFDSCDIAKYPAYNPRAEIPILVDDGLTIVNSADILLYLDRKYPKLAIYPSDPAAYATVRRWERDADTAIDAIVTDVAIYKWADIPPPPPGLIDAAKRDLIRVYSELETLLDGRDYVVGALSVADFALFPQLGSAQLLRIGSTPEQHPRVFAWLARMGATPEGGRDTALKLEWWAKREEQDLDTKRINWGTYRLEWFLANGFLDHFAEEVKGNRVLWSVGPQANANNSPLAP
ncbi:MULTISPECIES: glutathione S-transferase family protein [unclassified Sphingomonas]|uniref:glutathione S-transferase family protein n=1 Tax=unclassified Sphingomonas TaxID=196159 RepID=UPI000BDBC320|nr:MAG: hypothetical protein B7Z43_05045 [Sphingomonas sp. 12-62-6]OYX39763.1 MAG: hypothetical protein B7Y98_03940 [Sphingomonas sp. 32-62-10]OYY65849.1 MAG: hypothetical protein B7Y49_04980 [Sphingomonas sp. 28-62-11]